ncbi:MAG TPA: TonB-dependent receptor [Candidatus Sulfotelmatobacter sp.]|nr:TonB-dependent receptor [Candidatus Sulfotelmatobacter sp.]
MKSLSPMFAGSFGLAVRRSGARLAILLAAFSILFATHALAQEATIVGTVTDPSGASVPNVAITVTDVGTGLARNLTTGSDGGYVAPDLHIGRYTVRAQGAGFKVAEQKDIVLNVNDRTRVDFKLQVGSTTEQVTVEAAAIAVQADSGEVSDLITGQQLSQLSTNGRSMYSLISLAPGASSGQADFQIPTPVGGDANVSFNGMRESHNLYLLDGSESADRGGAGGSDVMPSLDAIAEFREMTSNYSAEFGLSSSATMTAVIKSGTRQYHATAWEFLRNDAFDARNYFNPSPQKVAELRFHTFGFNGGGPVDFWAKEHKTFFFYNMEWRRLIQGQTLTQTVPSTAWYGGALPSSIPISVPSAASVTPAFLFRNCPGGTAPVVGGVTVTQGSPFPNNTIPSCMIDPNSTLLLNAGIFPANNAVNPSGQPEFQGGNNVPTHVREEIVRIDHQFNSKFSVFGHWVDEQISQSFGTSMWSGDNVPTAANTFGNPSYSGVIHTTYVISPTLLNEVAFNYNGNRIAILPTGVLGRPTGFVSTRIFSGPNNDNRIPEIALQGYNGSDYTNSSWPWTNKADDYQIRDDVSWTKGAHQIKMGGSWALYKKVQDLFGNTQGSFGFKNNFTGNDFADFLLGTATSYNELAVQDHGYWNNVSWAAYVQDNWRVNHRLTLNLGLRWDGVPHTYEANDRMGNFYPNLYNPADAAIFVPGSNGNAICGATTAGCEGASPGLGTSPNPILTGYQFYLNGIGIPGKTPGVPKGLVNNHWAAFGPRVGFAYDMTGSGKTILRGGFGAMYERIQGNDMYNAGPNVPFSTNVNFNNVQLENPSTELGTGTPLVAPITVAGITGLDEIQNKLPVSYQYSLGVQQALSSRTVLSASYVGNQNRHQNDYRETNLPDPSTFPALFAANGTGYNTYVPYAGFNSIKMSEDVQNSHYDGLQIELHSQIRHDLTLQAAYTLSRAIDPATSGNGVSDLNSTSNPYSHAYDVGPSGLDRTNITFVNFIYDIPFLRDSSSRVLKSTVGGWQVSGIVTFTSGEPLNINEGGITNCDQGANNPSSCTGALIGTGNISSIIPNANNRPNVGGSIHYPKTVASWFGTSAFSPTVAGTWGNESFNGLRGPGRENWNLSLFKSFLFSESRGSKLEFRAEFFNAFNHTEFNNISTTYSSGNFGAITSAHDPREIQLGLKLYF